LFELMLTWLVESTGRRCSDAPIAETSTHLVTRGIAAEAQRRPQHLHLIRDLSMLRRLARHVPIKAQISFCPSHVPPLARVEQEITLAWCFHPAGTVYRDGNKEKQGESEMWSFRGSVGPSRCGSGTLGSGTFNLRSNLRPTHPRVIDCLTASSSSEDTENKLRLSCFVEEETRQVTWFLSRPLRSSARLYPLPGIGEAEKHQLGPCSARVKIRLGLGVDREVKGATLRDLVRPVRAEWAPEVTPCEASWAADTVLLY
jgi:hypothetical protein